MKLEATLKTSQEKIVPLEQAFSQAEDKIETLRHDYQFISQEKANLLGQVKQLQAILSKSNVVID